MKTGIQLISNERKRQINVKGYTAEHDINHNELEFIHAAMAYLMIDKDEITRTGMWPWAGGSFKPKNVVRDLTKAGALIAAAIDVIQNTNEDDSEV
jgi:hypothetical protein